MKTLGKLKLNQLNKDELTQREMEYLRGGGTPGNCYCGCGGSSSTSSNMGANSDKGHTTSIGTGDGNDACTCRGSEILASYSAPTGDGSCRCSCTGGLVSSEFSSNSETSPT